jgi:hypothetical protein
LAEPVFGVDLSDGQLDGPAGVLLGRVLIVIEDQSLLISLAILPFAEANLPGKAG